MNTIFVIASLVCGSFGCVTVNDGKAYTEQRTCLEASVELAKRFVHELPPDVRGELVHITPKCFKINLQTNTEYR